MTYPVTAAKVDFPDTHHDTYSKNVYGFWVYLMTDCLLFTTLFATYVVLHHETFGGPSSKELFNLTTSLVETFVLLLSSFTCGLAMLSVLRNAKGRTLFWFAISFLLGLSFVVIEVREFSQFVHEGNSWQRSAFLSSFFTLVGTHGLHVSIGLLWMFILMMQVLAQGFNAEVFRRLVCLSMFWHFLDVVWIFIFSVVYLMGVI